MIPFPLLSTERLTLREIVLSDAAALFEIHGNATAMRWFGTDPLTTVEQAEKLVETFAGWRKTPNPGIRWAMVDRGTNQLIGTCGLFKWNRDWKSCYLGYELSPVRQGSGFMNEALSAILPWGFEHMSLNRIEALIHPDNRASIRLVERLGFVCEGLLRDAGFWQDVHHDMTMYSLLARDFHVAMTA